MGQMGFYFDGTRCSGCRACQIACKDRNDLPVGVVYRRVRTFEVGDFPAPTMYHYSQTCNHCQDPACVRSCPTKAMYKAEDGTVRHDDEQCIGCKSCMMACPYGVPQYKEELRIVGKCDSCASLREAGLNPACVDACMMRALKFGEYADLVAEYGEGAVRQIAILPSEERTEPDTLIKPKEGMDEASCVETMV